MGELGKLSDLLETAQKYSTTVGKVWLTVLFVFRILVLKTAIDEVWSDEQSDFLCDTNQPGCRLVCYDKTFPMSHTRFWMMQILFVTTPTLIYLGHFFHWVREENKKKDKDNQQSCSNQRTNSSAEDKENLLFEDSLLRTYVFNIIFKTLLEVVFIIAHYYLYGFGLQEMYTCNRWPCLTTVFCYISRPTEKNIFIIFMLIMAFVSLVLNVAEVIYIIIKKNKIKHTKKYQPSDLVNLSESEN